ncbi:kelch-like protein 10 [Aulostomus maculatus]
MCDSKSSNFVMNELRLRGQFCDAVIIVNKVEFKVHKLILCNCSSYFEGLFDRWSSSDRKVYEISGLSPNTMKLIIEFAYTGCAPVTKANVLDLLKAADEFAVERLKEICISFLREMLCQKNCISIWKVAEHYNCSELQHRAHSFILDHFQEVVTYKEFLQLSAQDLSDFLKRDTLCVKKESIVFEVILRWISHAPEDRARFITVLLRKVRLALISPDFFMNNVLSNNLVKNNLECLPLTCSVNRVRMTLGDIPGVSASRHPLARPRLPTGLLFAIGGWSNGSATNEIEIYDIRVDRWVNMANNEERICAYHGSAFLNGFIYCIGGYDRMQYFSDVRRLDLSTYTWTEVSPMYHVRCYVSVTVLHGLIYAMGGFDGVTTRLRTAEHYNDKTNQWTLIAPMRHRRSDASCTTFNGKIYICGGFTGTEYLETAECYTPETNQWTFITPMSTSRSGIGVITYAGHIFAVGGYDGVARLHSAEAYNPLTNTWRNVPSMFSSRSNFGIEVVEDKLFVVGGYDGHDTTSSVEFFDAAINEWTEACEARIFRSALSCCIVSGLPNMADFAVCRDTLPLGQSEEEYAESSP